MDISSIVPTCSLHTRGNMPYSPEECVAMYTRITRIFAAVACGETVQARSAVDELHRWLAHLGPRDDPMLYPLLDAIQKLRIYSSTWEAKCKALVAGLQPLERKIESVVARAGTSAPASDASEDAIAPAQ